MIELGEKRFGVGDHGLDSEEVFINEKVVVHYDGVRLSELVDRLDVVFHCDLTFLLDDKTVSQTMNKKEDKHSDINEVTWSTKKFTL